MAVEREVKVKATADTRQGVAGMKAFAGAIGGVAAAAVAAAAAVVDFTIKQTEQLDTLGKTAKQLGSNTDEYQKLSFAAERSGASTQSFDRGIRTLNKNLEDISQGSGQAARKALESIGLSANDLAGKSAGGKLGVLADALNKVEDGSRRSALSMQLLGSRAGAELKPLLDSGSSGIRAMGYELEELGGVIDGATILAAEDLADTLLDTQKVIDATKAQITAEFIPAVKAGAEAMQEWGPIATQFAEELAPEFEKATTAAILLAQAMKDTDEAGNSVAGTLAFVAGNTIKVVPPFFEARVEAEMLANKLDELANSANRVAKTVGMITGKVGTGSFATDSIGSVTVPDISPAAPTRRRSGRGRRRGGGEAVGGDIGGEFTGDQEKINEAIAEQAKLNGEAATSIDNLIDLEQRRAEQAEITSQRVISLQEAEQEAYQAKLQTAVHVGEGIMSVTRGVTDTVAMAAQAQGASAEQVEKIQRKAKGIELMILGAVEVVKAATSYASFNYVEGALHTAAAALAFAQGGIILSGGVPGNASGGSQAATGGGATGPQRPASEAESDQPISPAETSARNQSQQSSTGGGGNKTINFNGNTFLGTDAKTASRDLKKMLRDGEEAA